MVHKKFTRHKNRDAIAKSPTSLLFLVLCKLKFFGLKDHKKNLMSLRHEFADPALD